MKPTQYFLDCKLIETIEREERLNQVLAEIRERKLRVIWQHNINWDNLNVYTYGIDSRENESIGFKGLIAVLQAMSE